MIKTAIIEDEDQAAEVLEEYLKRYSEESGVVFKIERFANPIPFLRIKRLNLSRRNCRQSGSARRNYPA